MTVFTIVRMSGIWLISVGTTYYPGTPDTRPRFGISRSAPVCF